MADLQVPSKITGLISFTSTQKPLMYIFLSVNEYSTDKIMVKDGMAESNHCLHLKLVLSLTLTAELWLL